MYNEDKVFSIILRMNIVRINKHVYRMNTSMLTNSPACGQEYLAVHTTPYHGGHTWEGSGPDLAYHLASGQDHTTIVLAKTEE